MRLDQIRRLVEMWPDPVNDFLEIGPGLGDLGAYIARRYPQARGVLMEFSEEGASKLVKRFLDNERIEVVSGDFLETNYKEAFDAVIACEVLEHIEDDRKALALVMSSLRPGGVFLMSVPAFMRKWQAADEYAGHFRRYERSGLRAVLEEAGFQVECIWCYGFPIAEIMYPLRQWYYGKRKRGATGGKKEATKRSGVERPFSGGSKFVPIEFIMAPFFVMQNAVRESDIGDGFLVLARKGAHP